MWKHLKSLFSHPSNETTPHHTAEPSKAIENPAGDEAQRANAIIDAGNALEERGDLAGAEEHYHRAVQLAPQFPRAHLNQGNLLLMRGQAAQALACYQTAAQLDPTYAAAHFNSGNAHFQLTQLNLAEAAYRRAIAIKPDFIDAYVALGAVLDQQQQYEAAISVYRQVLQQAPQYAQVHMNLALSLQKRNRFIEALASLHHALQLNPHLADTHVALGNALKDMGQVSEAETHYRQAIRLHPQHWDAYNGLLFALNYRPEHPPEVLLQEARAFGKALAASYPARQAWSNDQNPQRRLRIGFVSGDLRNHPVGYFLESVIAELRSKHPQLELIAFSSFDAQDELAQHFHRQFHAWHSIAALLPEQLEALVDDLAIDILIDLAGHNGLNRLALFARKCAPVQVTWLGYFATTGLETIDYLLADPHTLPPDQETYFTEKIWRLPETRLCFSAPRSAVAVNGLPALEKGSVCFASFNHLAKMNDAVVALWSRVLHAVPNSHLLLKSPPLVEAQAQADTLKRFAQYGIDAARIRFSGLSSRDDYFRAYHEVDMCLDPFPYTGGTTTMESLWMGVPVLSLSGQHFLARQGMGLLINAGLADWIAKDEDDYVQLVVQHSSNLPQLAQLRARLRPQIMAAPIGDAKQFAEHFADALRQMWQQWCARQSPP